MPSDRAERLFFHIAVKRGYLTPADVRRCQERAERARAKGRSASATGMALREGLIDAQTHHQIMQRVQRRETSERLTAQAAEAVQAQAGPAAPAGSPGGRRLRRRHGLRRTGRPEIRKSEPTAAANSAQTLETTEALETRPLRDSPLDAAARDRLLVQLGATWELVEDHHLEGCFDFPDLGAALGFVQLLGRFAMARGRELDLHLQGHQVRVAVWTEAIDGLSAEDYDFAADVSRLRTL